MCVQGFHEHPAENTSAPTVDIGTARTLMAIVAIQGWHFETVDVSRAFLQSENLKREVYIIPPQDAAEYGKLWKAIKPLYGLCDAPQKWYETLQKFLVQIGGRASIADKGLYYWPGKGNESTFRRKRITSIRELELSKPPSMLDSSEEDNISYQSSISSGVEEVGCVDTVSIT